MAATLLPAGLVVLRAPAGCGKSTFAHRLATEIGDPDAIVSTDAIRAEITGDASDHSAEQEVFALRDRRVTTRLRAGLGVIADSMNLTPAAVTPLVVMARAAGAPISLVDCSIPMGAAITRDGRRDRSVGTETIRSQFQTFAQNPTSTFERFAFDVSCSSSQVTGWAPSGVHGEHLECGFDVIGDVHGQLDAMNELIRSLGYRDDWTHPAGRVLVFVGDLIDKGPNSIGVLDAVADGIRRGVALCVRGNHEHKLARTLAAIDAAPDRNAALDAALTFAEKGKPRAITQIASDPRYANSFGALVKWLFRLPTHLVLDGGNLVVVHAAIRAADIGRTEFTSNRERATVEGICMYGIRTGTRDALGRPERADWVPDWDGNATVVHGHVTVDEPQLRNRVASIDAGAGDDATLAAYSWPTESFTTVEVASTLAVAAA